MSSLKTKHVLQRSDKPVLVIETHGDPTLPAIIFIHGFSQARQVWQHQLSAPSLANFYRVAIDLRGHGESEKPYHGYHGEDWAGDLYDVVEFLQIKTAFICAWSYGGMVTCDYIARYGCDNIKGIVFIAAMIGLPRKLWQTIFAPGLIEIATEMLSANLFYNIAATEKLIQRLTNNKLTPTEFNYLFAICMACPIYVREQIMIRSIEQQTILQSLTIPVLYIHGLADIVITTQASKIYQAFTPQASIAWFENVGHMPFWEQPEKFNTEIIKFLSDVMQR